MIAASCRDGVPATISSHAAAGTAWRAIVVGAGPAGAATAWRLAGRGVRTLLVDRHGFPRAKVCGSCLSPRAVRELLDLAPDALPGAAIPLETVLLATGGRHALVPLPAGRVVSRGLLDPHLVGGAIAAGCHWLPGVHVSAIADGHGAGGTGAAVVVASARGEPLALRADLVVLATGVADHVRVAGNPAPDRAGVRVVATGSRIGVGGIMAAEACDLPAGRLVMAVGRPGYCGLVRLEDGRIDVAAALDRAAVTRAGGAADAVVSLLAGAADRVSCPLPDAEAIRAAALRATPPLTRHVPLVAGCGGRVFRVGDAARYVEPFTGEGIGWALAAARILVAAVLAPQGLREPADAAARYVAGHDRELAPLHARCRLVAANLRSPTVVAAALAGARALPWAARALVPAVIGSAPRGAPA